MSHFPAFFIWIRWVWKRCACVLIVKCMTILAFALFSLYLLRLQFTLCSSNINLSYVHTIILCVIVAVATPVFFVPLFLVMCLSLFTWCLFLHPIHFFPELWNATLIFLRRQDESHLSDLLFVFIIFLPFSLSYQIFFYISMLFVI